MIEHQLCALHGAKHWGSQVWRVTTHNGLDWNPGPSCSKPLFPGHYVIPLVVSQCEKGGDFSLFHCFIFCFSFSGGPLFMRTRQWIEWEPGSECDLLELSASVKPFQYKLVFSVVYECDKLKTPVLGLIFIYVSTRLIQGEPGHDELCNLGARSCIRGIGVEEQWDLRICGQYEKGTHEKRVLWKVSGRIWDWATQSG